MAFLLRGLAVKRSSPSTPHDFVSKPFPFDRDTFLPFLIQFSNLSFRINSGIALFKPQVLWASYPWIVGTPTILGLPSLPALINDNVSFPCECLFLPADAETPPSPIRPDWNMAGA